MGDKITLKLSERTVHGKKVRALRREGVLNWPLSMALVWSRLLFR